MPTPHAYVRKRSPRWEGHEGERHGMLLCLSWLGRWHRRQWYLCQCDCGRRVERCWPNRSTLSCGCLLRALRKKKDFRVLKHDGSWGLVHAKPIEIDGRRFPSWTALARYIGIAQTTLRYRMTHWPRERWLEPGHPSGAGDARHRKRLMREKRKARPTFRPQPWARATMERVNAAGLNTPAGLRARASRLRSDEPDREGP
jgi:hypothetical protein